ncbi:MAG: hypothetical protein HYV66_01675 [Candidatus Sungbacteria bacterium]|uniref:Uncharacterized protein n=1 Tax=Candidatus Sungiibacteriota bacterium TaxID=2750080 RepID=A0A931YDJ0_9BACT|nr:hypothetical protein [Candidatus Sungbacteria bacterium]
MGRNKIFIFGGNTLYKFDLNRQTGSFESLESGVAITGVMEKPDNPNINFIATQDKIMVYGNSPEPRTAWFRTENQPAMNQITLYRESFYMLGEDGLIYRLPFSTSSTTSEIIVGDFALWTQQATSYKLKAKSFSVEGSIFGLTDEHTLVELANGQKKNEIVLKEAVQEIFTLSNHKNIYALSPADGLIVILDKNLNTKKRLFHPELAGTSSFVVNSQERVVYFLKGKTVYSFEI